MQKRNKPLERMKALFGAQDMTEGKPLSVLLRFAIPLLIGNIAQLLYNTVDAIIVGRYIGDSALAAVGASGPILNLLLTLFMGVSTGAGIVVAQYFGAKNREQLSKTVGNVILLTFAVTAIVMLLGSTVSYPLLSLMDTPDTIIRDANACLQVYFLGFLGSALYFMVSGILRGMGDSVMPLLYLLFACVLNIGLDILFVVVFKTGIVGVAWATILAQAISAVFCIVRLTQMKEAVDISWKILKPDLPLIRRIVGIGLPAGLTQAIFSCAAVVMQNLTNSFGDSVIATSTAVMRVDSFAVMPAMTLGMAITTYVGQNVGAGKMDRVNGAAKVGLKMSLSVCSVLTLCVVVFGKYLIAVFSDTPQVIELGSRMLRVMALAYLVFPVSQILLGIMRGVGDTVTPMINSIVSSVLFRIPIAYGMAYLTRSALNPQGIPDSIFFSIMSSCVIGMLMAVFSYRRGKWRRKLPGDLRSL